MSRYRPAPQNQFLSPLGQLSLPLDYSQSERCAPSHSCGQSKARRSRLSPDRLAKYQEMRERRGTEQESCQEITREPKIVNTTKIVVDSFYANAYRYV